MHVRSTGCVRCTDTDLYTCREGPPPAGRLGPGGELLDDGFEATSMRARRVSRRWPASSPGSQRSCAALTFELYYEPPCEEVQLRLTGPEGTPDHLKRGNVE